MERIPGGKTVRSLVAVLQHEYRCWLSTRPAQNFQPVAYFGSLATILKAAHTGSGNSRFKLVFAAFQGGFYRAAKDFFYYAQLRSQGEHTTRSRRLEDSVPIRELPNLLCALGEAPTQLELKNIFSECRGTEGVMHRQRRAGQLGDKQDMPPKSGRISFERLLELYLNQRASRPLLYSDVVEAFKELSKGSDGSEISPEALTHLLLTVRPRLSATKGLTTPAFAQILPLMLAAST